VRYSAFAELIGLQGIFVDKPEEVGGAWQAALNADRPTVLEVMADPNVPPLPPHLTFKQARAYSSAILRGDPDTRGIVRETIKEVLA